MGVDLVADAETTNGTAGTSVVVSRPPGTADGHVLVAFISCVGNATISTPAGWTLIGTANPSALVRLNAFWKVASSEPASWTWTLGASQRNWGWVGAHGGVDVANPIFATLTGAGGSDTGYTSGTSALNIHRQGGLVASAVAAVRTASGAATTWTASIFATEVADLSTNGGSGSDIGGCVSTRANAGTRELASSVVFNASQTQTAFASWSVSLRPAFTGYGGGMLSTIVEAAFGADPDGDPTLWSWTDISADVRGGVSFGAGQDTRGGIDEEAAPTKIAFRLLDTTGKYIPDNANGAHYPNIVEQVPVRVRVPFGYSPPTSLATAFVDRWTPTWDDNGLLAFVDVTASGRLQAVRDSGQPVYSVLRYTIDGSLSTRPHAYYPLEDESGATRVASILPGHQPLGTSGGVSFASVDDLAGSKSLPSVPDNGVIAGALGPGYAPTGQWCFVFAAKLPDTPVAVESRLMLVTCTGTAREWALWIVPGSPDTLNIRASTFGTSLLDDPVSIVEADHYGKWRLYSIGVKQNGANVDYQSWSLNADVGVGKSGTLASRTIGSARFARFVAFSALAGVSTGHWALFADPAFDIVSGPSFIAAIALEGAKGEQPHVRFARLCGEYNILADTVSPPSGSTTIGMGPQKPDRIGELLRQAGETDHGLLHDGTPSGAVSLVSRARLYNRDPDLVLDNALKQVPVGLRPTADSQGRITDSTVSRDGGSSARYVNPDARGSKPDAKTLSLETDQHLYEISGWRVTLGSQPGLRYSEVPLNLYANPTLTESWMRTAIGSRVKAINLPATHGPKEADGILVGWRQELDADRWMAYMVLAPARPYDVPVLESGDEKTWRLDMEGSTLAAAAGVSDTSLLVASSGEARWGTDVPYDLDVNGERITATAVAGSVTDTFTRTSANGWGAATTGQAWTTFNGAASDFAVSSNAGRITNNTTGVLRGVLLDAESTDVDFTIDLVFPNTSSATSTYERYIIARATDTANHYGLLLQLGTSGGTLTMAASKRVAGSFTNLASKTAGTNAAGNTWRARVQVIGVPGSTTLYVTARNLTAGTPQVALRVPLLDDPTLTGTNIGVIDRRNVGNTDGAIVGQWDNLDVTMPQTITVTRGVACGADAKAHTAGEPVRLWRARGVAL